VSDASLRWPPAGVFSWRAVLPHRHPAAASRAAAKLAHEVISTGAAFPDRDSRWSSTAAPSTWYGATAVSPDGPCAWLTVSSRPDPQTYDK
jgi:hypothetical protein